MTRLKIVVEGHTEEAFVKTVLAPHLRAHEVHPTPIIVAPSRIRRNRDHLGGGGSFGKALRTIRDTLRNDPEAYCTTMFDYYGLPPDYPGLNADDCPPASQLDKRIWHLEERLKARLVQEIGDTHRFLPYLQVHEFEALLFANVEVIDRAPGLSSRGESQIDELRAIIDHFDHPERIDDGDKTAPSKRLRSLFPRYDKAVHGEMIAHDIGLDRIREECPHFDNWVSRLETLDSPFS